MLDHLTPEELKWLTDRTDASLRKSLQDGAVCMMPGCGNAAEGRLPLFSVPSRFETELHLCTRCYEMLTTAQVAVAQTEEATHDQ